MKWFINCKTLEDLKAEYKKLVFKHHPDRGGDTATMQEINNEYDEMFKKVKNIHRKKDGEGGAGAQSKRERVQRHNRKAGKDERCAY